MGSQGRYYVRFKTYSIGKFVTRFSENLEQIVKRVSESSISKGIVRSMTFGKKIDYYFLVFENGGYSCCGAPHGLKSSINAKGYSTRLDRVSLGPNGTWFVKFKTETNKLVGETTQIWIF